MWLGGRKQAGIKQEKRVRRKTKSQPSSQFCPENIKIILIFGHPWARNNLANSGYKREWVKGAEGGTLMAAKTLHTEFIRLIC
jgi:hypothetical protein